MSQTGTPGSVLQRSFVDFDALCEQIRQWDLDLRQLERGRFSGEILQFASGPVLISEALFRRSVLQQGAPPPDLRTIAVPANPEMRFDWRGQACNGNSLLIFPRGAELESFSDSNFHVYTSSFSENLLASVCEQTGLAGLDALRDGKEVIRCSDETMCGLRRFFSEFTACVRTDSGSLQHPQLVGAATRELPRRILGAIATSEGVFVPVTSGKREQAVNRALRFIERQASEAISVREICAAVDVSQRTLEYAFRERFGVAPKSFLSAYRLNMVRKQLRTSDPRTAKVADAANEWGFWHMGQFAADYRMLFGELPSETLGSN